MHAAVEMVPVADHADAPRVGRPHGEACARYATQGAHLRAQFVVEPVMIALGEQMEIQIAEHLSIAVRIRQQRGRGAVDKNRLDEIRWPRVPREEHLELRPRRGPSPRGRAAGRRDGS